jgi:hypothetical protein
MLRVAQSVGGIGSLGSASSWSLFAIARWPHLRVEVLAEVAGDGGAPMAIVDPREAPVLGHEEVVLHVGPLALMHHAHTNTHTHTRPSDITTPFIHIIDPTRGPQGPHPPSSAAHLEGHNRRDEGFAVAHARRLRCGHCRVRRGGIAAPQRGPRAPPTHQRRQGEWGPVSRQASNIPS